MKLLDTTFLIHYWAGRNAVAEYLETHEETATFVTTPINLKELAVGRTLQGGDPRQEIGRRFNWVEVVPFGTEHAVLAGELEADLRSNGDLNQDKINALTGDVLIGAVALDLDAPVVTRNVEDFELLDGVEVETY